MVVLVFVALIARRVEKVAQEVDRQDESLRQIVGQALREKGLAKVH